MARNISFGIVALVLFFLCVMLGDFASSTMFPPPAGIDRTKPDSIRTYMDQVPLICFLVMMLGHAIGAFLAGLVIGRFTRNKEGRVGSTRTALIVGIIITAGGVMNLAMIPHPTWFWSDALIYPVFIYLGYAIGRPR